MPARWCCLMKHRRLNIHRFLPYRWLQMVRSFSHRLDLGYNSIGLDFGIPCLINWWFCIFRLRHLEITNILTLHWRHIWTYYATMSFSCRRVLDARIWAHWYCRGIILRIKVLHRFTLIIWHFRLWKCRFMCTICFLSIYGLVQVNGHMLVHRFLGLGEGARIATLYYICLSLGWNLDGKWLAFGLLG